MVLIQTAQQIIPGVHNVFLEHGIPMYVKAAFYGFVSAAALPIGACAGMFFYKDDLSAKEKEQQTTKTAYIMAFGAGALIFAVSTELYAESLRQVEHEGTDFAVLEIGVSMLCAVVGAIMFTLLNAKLEDYFHGEPETKTPVSTPRAEGAKRSEAAKAGLVKLKSGMEKLRSIRAIGLEIPTDVKPDEAEIAKQKAAQSTAAALWLGVALDGIPESILIGFITNEKAMTVAFLVSIFLANFPESFSSASLLMEGKFGKMKIFGLWMSLCIMTTILSGFAAWMIPEDLHHDANKHLQTPVLLFGAAVEGLAGGAMLAMVCATMLPEAFERGGRWSGLCAVLGFLASCSVKVYFGRAAGGNTEAAGAVIDTETIAEPISDAASVVEGGVETVVDPVVGSLMQVASHFLSRRN